VIGLLAIFLLPLMAPRRARAAAPPGAAAPAATEP
jgi:hypothetical protein